jgi:hypothetical protein
MYFSLCVRVQIYASSTLFLVVTALINIVPFCLNWPIATGIQGTWMLCVLMAVDGKYTARQNVILQLSHCRSGNRKQITPEKKTIAEVRLNQ